MSAIFNLYFVKWLFICLTNSVQWFHWYFWRLHFVFGIISHNHIWILSSVWHGWRYCWLGKKKKISWCIKECKTNSCMSLILKVWAMTKQTNDEASGKESILHLIKSFLLYLYVRETKLYHPDLLQCKWSAETGEIDTLVKVACTSTHLTIINTCF